MHPMPPSAEEAETEEYVKLVAQQSTSVASFLSLEAAILVVSATVQDLWQGPKQEIRESRTSAFVHSLGNLKQ